MQHLNWHLDHANIDLVTPIQVYTFLTISFCFPFLITIHFLHVFSKTELNPQNTFHFTEQEKNLHQLQRWFLFK